jgi:hypothetical protein
VRGQNELKGRLFAVSVGLVVGIGVGRRPQYVKAEDTEIAGADIRIGERVDEAKMMIETASL